MKQRMIPIKAWLINMLNRSTILGTSHFLNSDSFKLGLQVALALWLTFSGIVFALIGSDICDDAGSQKDILENHFASEMGLLFHW